MNRAAAEVALIGRCGNALLAVEKDGATRDGTNPDLVDAMWFALKRLSYSPAAFGSITDADIGLVSSENEEAFIDLAELRLLETCLNAATALVNISIGPRSESYGQFASALERRVEAKRVQVNALYGLAGSTLEGGVINLNFQEDGTNEY